ncbi:MAG TPA: thioredoxin domain-containing protein [Chthoniobacterales bacterium]
MNAEQHSVAANAELDERGILVTCPHCGKRNRLKYEGLKRTFHCGQCHSELGAPLEPIDVTSDLAFDAATSRSTVPVLADFWAPWCGPCKMVAPELRKIAAEGVGRWLVIKVNTEELPSLSQRFRVTAIPTMILFQGGFEKARQAGAMPAPAIRKFLEPWVCA